MNSKNNYKFLPFRFVRKNQNVLLTNETGEFSFVSPDVFDSFINKRLMHDTDHFLNLKSKGFLYDNYLAENIEVLATKYRTKHQFLYEFTSLHMFVITLRCNQKCTYCHASSQDEGESSVYDMDEETARNSVEIAFQTPSPYIKIEFQGGEPLLNFKIIKVIVEHAQTLNEKHQKHLEFVICTNLVGLKQYHLDYFKKNDIIISTSLDGSRDIHDKCRKLRNGKGSYDYVLPNIEWALKELGKGKVTALMTVTPFNVHRLQNVVDEYLRLNLEYIFIRKLNPFGFAYKNEFLDYSTEDFIKGYKNVLDYIIALNSQGIFFPEVFSTILFSRILTPFSTGFVDLQSPTGAGISGVIYDVNGDVFVSDEARMIYRTTGDKFFCIGNTNQNTWKEIFCNSKFKNIIKASCIDALPGCAWCVYKPYCGGDPVRNYLTQGDMTGYRPTNDFCQKHYVVFDMLFHYLEQHNKDIEDVFWSWITNRSLEQVKNYQYPEVSEDIN